jgi:hypothetical protein
MAWERVLVIANSCQEIRTTAKNVVPTRDYYEQKNDNNNKHNKLL